MARTPNPLHDYVSYSYHHILIACDTTEAAESIANLSSTETTNVGEFTDRIFSKEGASQVGVQPLEIAGGRYVVAINGAKDAAVSIADASWQTLVTPNLPTATPELTQATFTALEGTIEIVEPRGIDFMNIVNEIGVALQTGPTGLTWVLKTIFVGQREPSLGGSSIEFITYVKPLVFYMLNITANFNEAGSVYEMSFVGQSNGVGRVPQYSRVDIPAISFARDKRKLLDVLGATLLEEGGAAGEGGLRQAIQASYDEYVLKSEQTIGRKIRYEIKLDPHFADYEVDELITSQSGGGNGGGVIQFGSNMMIDNAIAKIMNLSSRVKTDATQDPKRIYKVTSTMITNQTEAVVTYTVRSYIVPEARTLGQDPNVDTSTNVLEYDYIYTGNNIDIKKFDIRMEMGLAFFQLLEASSSLREDQKEQPEQQNNRSETEETRSSVDDTNKSGAKQGNPTQTEQGGKTMRIIFPGQQHNKKFQKNHLTPEQDLNFQNAINKHASIENLEAKIEIHGNPNILNDYNTIPSDVANLIQASNTTLAADLMHQPTLCKINIMMPSTNSLTGVENNTFAKRFWYEGYYSLLMIEHRFRDGMFTQVLDIMSIPQS